MELIPEFKPGDTIMLQVKEIEWACPGCGTHKVFIDGYDKFKCTVVETASYAICEKCKNAVHLGEGWYAVRDEYGFIGAVPYTLMTLVEGGNSDA